MREYKGTVILGQPLTERELWDAVSLSDTGERPLSVFLLGPEATRNTRDGPIR